MGTKQGWTAGQMHRRAMKQNKKIINSLRCKYCEGALIRRREAEEAFDTVMSAGNNDESPVLTDAILDDARHRARADLEEEVKKAREQAKKDKEDGKTKTIATVPGPTDEDVEKLALTYAAEDLQKAGEELTRAAKLITRHYDVECNLHCVKLLMQNKQMQLEIDLGQVR